MDGINRQELILSEASLYLKRNANKRCFALETVLVPVLVHLILWGSVSLLGIKSSLGREGLQRCEKGAMEKLIWLQNSTVVALGTGYLHSLSFISSSD